MASGFVFSYLLDGGFSEEVSNHLYGGCFAEGDLAELKQDPSPFVPKVKLDLPFCLERKTTTKQKNTASPKSALKHMGLFGLNKLDCLKLCHI